MISQLKIQENAILNLLFSLFFVFKKFILNDNLRSILPSLTWVPYMCSFVINCNYKRLIGWTIKRSVYSISHIETNLTRGETIRFSPLYSYIATSKTDFTRRRITALLII